MKKRELFKISPEAGNLVRKYDETWGADISLYADPSGKRTRLRKAAENLLNRICRVDDSNPSFDEVSSLALDIAGDCMAKDAEPAIPMTKAQVYDEILGKLAPLLEAELLGKCICIKNGVSKFKYIRIDGISTRKGMCDGLEVHASGWGFHLDTREQCCGHVTLPAFGRKSANLEHMLLTGKDECKRESNDYSPEWLYVLSEEEFRKQFTDAVAEIAGTLGICGYPGIESKFSLKCCPAFPVPAKEKASV